MRSFRRIAARWPISVLCVMTFVSPIIGTVLTPLPALAQTGTIEVAVVDFRNSSKMPNEMFGTMATDAVVVELLRSGKFGVTASDTLQAKMEELGYKSKEDRALKLIMTPSMMVRLGEDLGVDGVIHGEITSIKVDSSKRKAEVRLVVRMLHVASGEWSNGAIATGTSNPRIGYSAEKDTDLIIEAINNAARQAVETMVQYIIPEATIIGTFSPTEVLLNKGASEGLKAGMEMIVLRRIETGEDEVVGRLKITTLGDNDAHGTVISTTRGLKPEDRVRAVYELPLDTGGKAEGSRLDSRNRIAKGGKLLWGLVALIGLATLFKGGGDQGEGVPSVVAMAGTSPDVTSLGADGGIEIGWNNPKGIRYTDIVEFHVWRDNQGHFGSQTGSDATNVGPVMINDDVSSAGMTTPVGSFDHIAVDDAGTRKLGFQSANTDHTALVTGSIDTIGIQTGRPHQYWLTCLYKRHSTDSSGKDVITYWETEGSYAGRATYLVRPQCDSPGGTVTAEYVDLTNVTFRWRGSGGADQYVIEISPSSSFVRDHTWVDVIYQPTSADGQLFTKTYTNVLKDSSSGTVVTELASVPAGGTVYWRVGARNRMDVPGPCPALPTPQVSGPKNTRYIYSDMNQYFSFMTLPDMPEPPPDTGGGDNGGGDIPPPPPPL